MILKSRVQALGALVVSMVGAASVAVGQPAAGNSISGERGGGIALDGYCPVSLATGKGWVGGVAEFQSVFDGRVYRFATAEALTAFESAPTGYIPALGGDDIVEYARTGQRVAGELAFGLTYLDRRYFFASEATKEAFQADPTSFANADLAFGGMCAVCRTDLGRYTPGDSRFVSLDNGLRYLFASAPHQQTFQAQPSRYIVTQPVGGPGTR